MTNRQLVLERQLGNSDNPDMSLVMREARLASIRHRLEVMDRARLTYALTVTETIQYNHLVARERRLLRRVVTAASGLRT
jgi:hypothetical protein